MVWYTLCKGGGRMEKDLLEMFQLMIDRFDQIESQMKAMETCINLKLENEVTRRIDSLFDGYKLAHEKQWELDRQVRQQQAMLEQLAARLAVLESKIA